MLEYFEHFPLLEIDYSFYRLLLKKNGKPTPNFHVLRNYRQHMKEGDLLLLKVPQVIFARKVRRGAGFAENDSYFNGIFTKRFYKVQWKFLALAYMGSSLSRNTTSRPTGSHRQDWPGT